MGDNEQAVLEAKLAKEEEEAAAAQRNLLIGIGIVMILITAGVVVVLRKRMAEGETPAKDFSASGLPSGTPDMSAQPTTPMPDMTAQPTAVQAVAEPLVASAEPVAPPAETPAEPTVVNQWTDENGHTWRVMSDGTNRWWNGTDWQKV